MRVARRRLEVGVERPAVPEGTCLIIGLARAGCAAADALLDRRQGQRLVAWDRVCTPGVRATARRLRARGVDVYLGGDGSEALLAAGAGATLVKSPGIGMDAPVVARARAAGLCVIDELELGWRLSDNRLVGVTGTNGKSTTSRLIAAVLSGARHPVELSGNTEFGLPLSAAGRQGGWTVCEVSSFQLECSPAFLPDVAVFTNLTPEHLDRHGTMEAYAQAKRRMFVRAEGCAPVAVLNRDDRLGASLVSEVAEAGGRVLSYGFSPDADVRVEAARWSMREAQLRLLTPDGPLEFATRLPGAHNARNVAAAIAVAIAVGVPCSRAAGALSEVSAPAGRWSLASREDGQFDVLIDYAHTPDGLRQVLEAIRCALDARGGGELHTVFGAVGLRDARKARESAGVAGALSDRLTLTTGSAPRDARVVRLQELRRAAGTGAEVSIVLERRAAIESAIAAASAGDVVAVLGLGALKRMTLDAAGTVGEHDDREVARSALARLAA